MGTHGLTVSEILTFSITPSLTDQIVSILSVDDVRMEGEEAPPTDYGSPIQEAVTDMKSACKDIIRNAMVADGLIKGIHETAKRIEHSDSKQKAKLVILAKSVEESEPNYNKLVKALCREKEVPLIEFPDSETLGVYCGLYPRQSDGTFNTERKKISCGVACIVDYGMHSQGYEFVLKELAKEQA